MRSPSLSQNQSPSTDRCAALVCFALPDEARFFSPPSESGRVETLLTGIGRANAKAALQRNLERHLPQMVLTCGFAGGLRHGLTHGDLLFSSDPGLWLPSVLLELGAVEGVFFCSDRIAVTAQEKALLYEKTKADAVEMESEAIRSLCRSRGIPSATIRVISDPVDEDLPLDFNKLATSSWKLDPFRLAWAIARSPQRIPALLRLQRQTRLAARALGRVLGELLRRQGGRARV